MKDRLQAFSIHLAISFLLFIILGAFIRWVWYPSFLFEVDGGWQGIKLIAGVDLVVGPLLTLLVFNKAKASLRRDLAVVGFLQLLCIVGGMWVVGTSRPLVVAYYEGTFSTVNKHSFENANILYEDAKEHISWFGPSWVALKLPDSAPDREIILKVWDFLGEDIATNVKLYTPFKKANFQLLKQGRQAEEDYLKIYKYSARYYHGELLVDIRSGEVVELLSKL
ncbi:hypothetical protein [Microbulbifer variabilis]|uniref:hypothetical protein n=1 Tax=Microbulbifer variabilis TaxID=266805 RepID=UPI001CFF3C69|nr:hypothetical protein [Microbulbifer variabilis]